MRRSMLAGLAAGLFLVPTLAEAATTITSVPYVINYPGDYVLTSNLTTYSSGPAIRINASNVNLDLQGHTLTAYDTAIGSTGQKNVSIRNGSAIVTASGLVGIGVANSFWNGIYDTGFVFDNLTITSPDIGIFLIGSSHLVNNIHVTGYRAVFLGSSGTFVQGVTASQVPGTTAYGYGLWIWGTNNTVLGSTFSGFDVGIYYNYNFENPHTGFGVYQNNNFNDISTAVGAANSYPLALFYNNHFNNVPYFNLPTNTPGFSTNSHN